MVTLPTIGDREEADVAREIGRAWGVGATAEIGDPRRNAGIVLLVVPRQDGRPGTGRVRIEVGQGLEGIVTDVTAGRIRDLMGDRLASEDYSGALLDGVEALAGIIARGFGVSDTALTNARPVADATGNPPAPRGCAPHPALHPLPAALGRARPSGRRRRRNVFWGGPWIGGGFGAVGAGAGEGSAAAGSVASGAAADSAAAAPEEDSDARRRWTEWSAPS